MKPYNNIGIIAQYTLLETIRGKILRVFLALSFLVMLGNVFITELFSWSLGKVSIEFGMSIASLTGLLIIFFLVIRLFYKEIENQTIYFVFSKPVSYIEYIWGKYIGFLVLLIIAECVFCLGTALSLQYVILKYPLYISPLFTWNTFFQAFFLQLVGLAVVLAFSIFWSSFMTEPFIAMITTIITYLIGINVELIRKLFIDVYVADINRKALYWVAKGTTYVLPNLNVFDQKSDAAYGVAMDFSRFCLIVSYGVLYCIIVVMLAVFFFSKRKSL